MTNILFKNLANHNAVGNDNRDGYKNCEDMDNQPAICGNVIEFVPQQLQRSTGEDSQTNKPDTSARRFKEAMI